MKSSTNSTRASPSAKACADAIRGAVAASLVLSALGCASGTVVHTEYSAVRPRAIAVHPVANETLHQLDQVSFGGILQRVTVGVETIDVPVILRGALEEALLMKDYSAPPFTRPPGEPEDAIPVRAPESESPPRPLPAAWASLPFDAVLVPAIESWQASTMGSSSVGMRFRVVIYRLPGMEVLYSTVYEGSYREDVRTRGNDMIPAWIRRSARKALADLPAGSP